MFWLDHVLTDMPCATVDEFVAASRESATDGGRDFLWKQACYSRTETLCL